MPIDSKIDLEAIGPSADRPKKQGTRMLKAECVAEGCGYPVRVSSKWLVELGPPHCPKHGPMRQVEEPEKAAALPLAAE